MLRPDLLQAVRDLAPPFIRWPGGSFASTYKWKDGIGPQVSRPYTPNTFWGGYSDGSVARIPVGKNARAVS